METRPPNSVIDVILAAYQLEIEDDVDFRRITAMLGIGMGGRKENASRKTSRSTSEPGPTRPEKNSDEAAESGRPEQTPAFDLADDAWLDPASERPTREFAHPPDVEPFPMEGDDSIPADLSVPPLFEPMWIRALIAAVVGATQRKGDVDVEAVVDTFAHAQLLRSLFIIN